jgi:hypothetical protein
MTYDLSADATRSSPGPPGPRSPEPETGTAGDQRTPVPVPPCTRTRSPSAATEVSSTPSGTGLPALGGCRPADRAGGRRGMRSGVAGGRYPGCGGRVAPRPPRLSAGVRGPRHVRGRLLPFAAMASRSSWLNVDRFVPLGRYCWSSLLVFSSVPPRSDTGRRVRPDGQGVTLPGTIRQPTLVLSVLGRRAAAQDCSRAAYRPAVAVLKWQGNP